MQAYRHTQIGWGFVAIITVALVVAVLVMVRSDLTGGLTMALIAVAIFALFGTMTVELDDTHLRLWFGIGTFRKKIGFNEIRAFHPVRNRWYHGWGVRWFPRGWLYNVSGLSVSKGDAYSPFALGFVDAINISQDNVAAIIRGIDR